MTILASSQTFHCKLSLKVGPCGLLGLVLFPPSLFLKDYHGTICTKTKDNLKNSVFFKSRVLASKHLFSNLHVEAVCVAEEDGWNSTTKAQIENWKLKSLLELISISLNLKAFFSPWNQNLTSNSSWESCTWMFSVLIIYTVLLQFLLANYFFIRRGYGLVQLWFFWRNWWNREQVAELFRVTNVQNNFSFFYFFSWIVFHRALKNR